MIPFQLNLLIEQIEPQTWRIAGAAPLNLVSQQLGVELPEDGYDTFGGLIFGLLGSIPEDGSTPELEVYGLIIKVTEIRNHRLETALVSFDEADGCGFSKLMKLPV